MKCVLVVSEALGMGPGKVASQCAHAAAGSHTTLPPAPSHLPSCR
jgi:peptidyl-tRNA hydrolase